MVAPEVRFLTEIYHPNIDKLGRISLDILREGWRPYLQITSVLVSLPAFMSMSMPDDACAEDVAKTWRMMKPKPCAQPRSGPSSLPHAADFMPLPKLLLLQM